MLNLVPVGGERKIEKQTDRVKIKILSKANDYNGLKFYLIFTYKTELYQMIFKSRIDRRERSCFNF